MKTVIGAILALAMFICSNGHAQEMIYGERAKAIVPQADAIRLNANTAKPDFIQLSGNVKIPAAAFVPWIKIILKPTASEEFKPFRTETDRLGYTHTWYQLYFHNILVEKAVFIGHFNDAGWIGSANGFYRNSGEGAYDSPVPGIGEKQAMEICLAKVAAIKYKWEDMEAENLLKRITGDPGATYYPNGQLVYFPENGEADAKRYHLAYKFDVYAQQPLSRTYLYVDAASGELLFETSRIHSADVTGTAVTKYSGAQSMVADSYGGNFRLRESGRGGGIETYNMQNGTSVYSAVDFLDGDNYWNNINANQDEVATDAHWGAEMTYDFFYYTVGRNSYDNSGATVLSYIHYDYAFSNAFWDGTSMTYGDGDGVSYEAFTPIDVVGHEFGHGVTEYSAGLDYYSESGALNESYSDIFGTVVEFYAKPSSANYLLGEENTIGGGAIRSMSNPNLFGNPDTYMGNYWDPFEEVHNNSGPQNYWFYLLSAGGSGVNDIGNNYSVNGIGIDDAFLIAYRTLTVYLTPSSNYYDAMTYSIVAAEDLFGACSPEVAATQMAWYAVGIGSTSSITVAGFTADITSSCTLPVTINFSNLSSNATNYIWDFGDGDSSTLTNPSHTYVVPGAYNVQLIATGTSSCGSGSDTLLSPSYITVSNTGQPIYPACQPTTLYSGYGSGITNVSFNAINNSSMPGDGYNDYTCSSQTAVVAGSTYPIFVETGLYYEEDVEVWIDYNNDGDFSVNESVYSSSNVLQYHSGSIYIPTNAIFNTLLRMRVGTEISFIGSPESCLDAQYGQFEDYTVTVTPNTVPPVGAFSFQHLDTCQGIVHFTDNSTLNTTDWFWDFGDGGGLSLQQNPYYSYSAAGTFVVTLVVSNAYGSDTLSQAITINALKAEFSANGSFELGSTVVFTDSSTSAISWSWEFGDGYSSYLQNPTYLYAAPGIYLVKLTVSNSAGCTAQSAKEIVIVPVGVGEMDSKNSFSVLPNPANEEALVAYMFTGRRHLKITIESITGQMVYSEEIADAVHFRQSIELSSFSEGLYYLRIIDKNEIKSRKLVIIH